MQKNQKKFGEPKWKLQISNQQMDTILWVTIETETSNVF